MKKSTAIIVILILGLLLIPKSKAEAPNNSNTYPSFLASAKKDSMLDSWDMPNRECTSYVAWKIYETYHYQTRDWGAAYQWDFQARARGLQVDSDPSLHSVAVDTSFKPGHVMWIEKVNQDGTIYVSEYNHDNLGNYDHRTLDRSGLSFIHL